MSIITTAQVRAVMLELWIAQNSEDSKTRAWAEATFDDMVGPADDWSVEALTLGELARELLESHETITPELIAKTANS